LNFEGHLTRSKMSDTAAAAKSTKKRAGGAAKAKKHADHPTYSEMIKAALEALKVCNLSHYTSWLLRLLFS